MATNLAEDFSCSAFAGRVGAHAHVRTGTHTHTNTDRQTCTHADTYRRRTLRIYGSEFSAKGFESGWWRKHFEHRKRL